MKKFILLTAILALSFGALSCGGGGAGSANLPPGENPGIPSIVQLTPSHFVAQTNSNITFHAKVLDGNGAPIKGVTVTFTNLSEPFGTLKSVLRKIGLMSPIATLSATTAVTDGSGIATVNLFSSTAGFATIVSQVNVGVSNVRDRKTVIFVSSDSFNLSPTLTLDVSKDGVTFNQPGDFTLFKTADDNQRLIRATVRDRFGLLVSGASVAFSSDASSGVTFSPVTATTDNNGQAFTLVTVSPTVITDVTTVLNITATATLPNGTTASNVLSLFLSPVTISSGLSSITAIPTIVAVGGTSNVTATVITSVGTPAPDGTTVNFTTAPKTASDPSPCGSITPFAQTSGGVTTPAAIFTAPLVPGTCTVTGTSGGVTIGFVDILVNIPLSVQPGTLSVDGGAGGTATFTIFGGVPPYTVIPNNADPKFLPVLTGSTFTVTIPAGTATTSVAYRVVDQTGANVVATLNVTVNGLQIVPKTASIASSGSSQTLTFNISGGTGGYVTTSSDPSKAFNTTAGNGVWPGTPITVTFPANVTAGAVTLNVFDSSGTTTTATITILAPPPAVLRILPPAVTIVSSTVAQTATFTISGGTPQYITTSTDPTKVFNTTLGNGVWNNVAAITATIPANVAAGAVTLNVSDSVGGASSATITIIAGPATGPLNVTPASVSLTGLGNVSAANTVRFTITGGTPGYSMFSNNTTVIPSLGALGAGVTFFDIHPATVGVSTAVTITVVDSVGATKTATVTVTPLSAGLTLNPSSITVVFGSVIPYSIFGGSPPYPNVFTSNACVTITGVGPTQFNVDTTGCGPLGGTAIITVEDSASVTAISTITITP